MKILIAEDDLVSRRFLSKFLGSYGECDLVVDGLETLDAFLLALKDGEPYDLICLDIMMPKVDGLIALKAIRNLEEKYGVAPKNRARIIMTTALAEEHLIRTSFDLGCEAYAAKPIETNNLLEVMRKLGLVVESPPKTPVAPPAAPQNIAEKDKNTTKQSMRKNDFAPTIFNEPPQITDGYFKSVRARPNYQLEVTMETGTAIHFDFRSRLNTARFGMLRDEELFRSAHTDGNYLIFSRADRMPVRITASEFMDLVMIDRRKQTR